MKHKINVKDKDIPNIIKEEMHMTLTLCLGDKVK